MAGDYLIENRINVMIGPEPSTSFDLYLIREGAKRYLGNFAAWGHNASIRQCWCHYLVLRCIATQRMTIEADETLRLANCSPGE